MNSNDVNNAFCAEALRCQGWLGQRLGPVGSLPAKVLTDRLVQRVLELGRLPHAQQALQGRLAPGSVLDIEAASLEISTGRILLTPRQWWRGLLQYLVHWAYCCFALLAVRGIDAAGGPVTLVSGIGEEALFQGGTDADFVRYCQNGPIAPLREGARLFIQSRTPGRASVDARIRYARRPLIELLRCAPMGALPRLRALAGQFLALPVFLMAAVRRPELALLGRDLAYVAPARAVDAAGQLGAVMMTCTSITEQPLWGRCLHHARVHMVWYAQNWKPVVFLADGVESDIPLLRWVRVDAHWVWTEAFGAYLRAQSGQANFHAVGPIVWRMPPAEPATQDPAEIVVFDVSPYSDATAMSYCESPNYNSPANLQRFIGDILAFRADWQAHTGQRLNLRVKTKRGYNPAYDRPYFDYLEQLHAAGAIQLEPHASDIHALIRASRVVLAYPFTSPPYIADVLGVPSIYYDPTCSIAAQTFAGASSLIRFAAGRSALRDMMATMLQPVYDSRGQAPGISPEHIT